MNAQIYPLDDWIRHKAAIASSLQRQSYLRYYHEWKKAHIANPLLFPLEKDSAFWEENYLWFKALTSFEPVLITQWENDWRYDTRSVLMGMSPRPGTEAANHEERTVRHQKNTARALAQPQSGHHASVSRISTAVPPNRTVRRTASNAPMETRSKKQRDTENAYPGSLEHSDDIQLDFRDLETVSSYLN